MEVACKDAFDQCVVGMVCQHQRDGRLYNTRAPIDLPCLSDWKPRAQLGAMRLRESMTLWKPRFVGGKIVWQR